jgi:hypothetical protein
MYLDRLNRLRAALAQAKLDCTAAIAGPNLYYLTGLSFHLSERPTTGFFPAHGDPVIVSGNLEASKVATAPYPIKGCFYTDADGPVAAYREAANALRLGGRGGGVARLGVETRRMRVMELRLIEEAFLNPRLDASARNCWCRPCALGQMRNCRLPRSWPPAPTRPCPTPASATARSKLATCSPWTGARRLAATQPT